ncbi:unnamed protein product [Phaedon cochleariae]|uniref:Protein kinase domain-containing protein n=1 Tax=Phaedon cochleariae TaxID=80249 RepID=A0A9N9SBZ0_PHACE|nr:unnamed protein product [Phaedon cochleariae]
MHSRGVVHRDLKPENLVFTSSDADGLLTVDPARRLRMVDLQHNAWIQGSQSFPQTPLMTPDVLGSSAEKSVQTTFNAFHLAEREGFRRMKKSSSDNNSSSSSSFTSDSSLKSAPPTPLKRPHHPAPPRRKTDTDERSEATNADQRVADSDQRVADSDERVADPTERVADFLHTMSPDPIDPNASDSGRLSGDSGAMRASTGSSGIAVSDKNSIDSKKGKKIDGEPPVEFVSLPHRTRKRKATEEPEKPDVSRAKKSKAELARRGRKRVQR